MSTPPEGAGPGDPVDLALDVYVEEWFGGEPPDPDTFCREHPECGADLKARIEDLLFIEERLKVAPALEGQMAGSAVAATSGVGKLGPYRLVREIGRGAQGIVYLAEDTRLHRQVAVKVMRVRGPGSERLLARFLREGEVASRLEHPGICTVYDTGVDGGTSYIAMRYVEGESLAQKISQAKVESGGSPGASSEGNDVGRPPPSSSSGPSTRREIMEVVGVVEKAARALHAAHCGGVIHRDIKPGNIMVTPEGEPVITDFGLARTESVDLPTLTLSGELFGTPAYMCPEQLSRQAIRVDARADVWSLAVTLYECLTLRRPYEAPTREGLYQAILMEDATDVRKVNPAVPRDLKGILDTALEKNRDRRYESALHFAEDLRRARALQRTVAKPIGPVGRALRWARRRPYRTALFLLLLAVAAGSSYVAASWPEYQRTRQRARLQQEEEQRQKAERRIQDGYVALHEDDPAEAVEAFQKALAITPESVEAIAGIAFAYLDQRSFDEALVFLSRHEGMLSRHGSLQALRVRILEQAGDTEEAEQVRVTLPAADAAEDRFVLGYLALTRPHIRTMDAPLWALDDEDACEKCLANGSRALELFRRAVFYSPKAPLLYHVLRARAARRARNASAAMDSAELLTARWPDSAYAWYGRGRALFQQEDLDESAAAYRKAIELRPDDFYARRGLGRTLEKQGKADEAISAYSRAVACTPKSSNYSALGDALARQREYPEAVAAYRAALAARPVQNHRCRIRLSDALMALGNPDQAIAVLREGARIDAEDPIVPHGLGCVLWRLGRYDEAIEAYRQAFRNDPTCALARQGLVRALSKRGLHDEAIEVCRRSIHLDPDDAEAHRALGDTLFSARHYEEALSECRKALDLDPGLDLAYGTLGCALRGNGRLDEAIEAYTEYIRRKPGDTDGYSSLADALLEKGLPDDALETLEQALAIDPKDAQTICNVGQALLQRSLVTDAIQKYREAIEIDSSLAVAHQRLGNALRKKGLHSEAIEAYRSAIGVDPYFAVYHSCLGHAFMNTERLDEAVGAYRAAASLDPGNPHPHYNLGNALMRKGCHGEAAAAHRRAIGCNPDFAEAHCNLGIVLTRKSLHDDAIKEFRSAIQADANLWQAYTNMGNVLIRLDRLDEAIDAFRQGVEIDAENPSAHYGLGRAFQRKWLMSEAEAEYRKTVELKPDHASALCNLGHVLNVLGRHREALEALKEGHAIGSSRGWNNPSGQWVAECEAMLRNEEVFEVAVKDGRLPEAGADIAFLARVAITKGRPALAAEWYRRAFDADPELPTVPHRYDAACSGVLAAAGKDRKDGQLDAAKCVEYRTQALAWLEKELESWEKRYARDEVDPQRLWRHLGNWRQDTDLESVRGDAIDLLPPDEQEGWRELWARLDRLLEDVE